MTLGRAQRLAFQAIPSLTPTQFWRLTPAELGRMLEGAVWRDRRTWQREAWKLAHLMNISGKSLKQKMTPEKLLGEKNPATKGVVVRDPERDFSTLWERHLARQH